MQPHELPLFTVKVCGPLHSAVQASAPQSIVLPLQAWVALQCMVHGPLPHAKCALGHAPFDAQVRSQA